MTARRSYNERFTFERPTEELDDYGVTKQAWEAVIQNCPCDMMNLRGGEAVQASRLDGRQPVVIYIRKPPNSEHITPEWRVRDTRSTAIYEIASIVETEDRGGYEITATRERVRRQ
jgi:head-tail adaptor